MALATLVPGYGLLSQRHVFTAVGLLATTWMLGRAWMGTPPEAAVGAGLAVRTNRFALGEITLKLGGNSRTLNGQTYLLHNTLPNFFFHVTTAYAILRHCGVEIGKSDFLGQI